ncbi:hypothetical protein OE88DRAFT_198010 [Heliocybe sulcata]|uniref:Uncharacterized protein n=1 Tax=Heliocybe sulcata TaxID=5364 RepID=A0A5C3N494_9AGAM|nr:hypothetical protein OE88DRAFT_198010 [Heliocybe sulcata]
MTNVRGSRGLRSSGFKHRRGKHNTYSGRSRVLLAIGMWQYIGFKIPSPVIWACRSLYSPAIWLRDVAFVHLRHTSVEIPGTLAGH